MNTTVTQQLVWLPAYPKSGNTWLRFLLANLLNPDLSFSQNLKQLTEELHLAVPDIHSQSTLGDICNRETVYAKVHTLYQPQMVLPGMDIRFIYMARNPLDVIFSNLNYFLLTSYSVLSNRSPVEIDNLCWRYIDSFIEHGGDPRWSTLGMGTWSQHVESWLDNAARLPYLLLRYEDLLANPDQEIARICQFLKLDCSVELIKQAIANSSFARMQELEEQTIQARQSGLFYSPDFEPAYTVGIRFVSRGRVGEGQQFLSTDQLERVKAVFGPGMQRVGYKL